MRVFMVGGVGEVVVGAAAPPGEQWQQVQDLPTHVITCYEQQLLILRFLSALSAYNCSFEGFRRTILCCFFSKK